MHLFFFFGLGFSGQDDLYTELWKACAGPLVDVPKPKESVYYFPQGHMEQVSVLFSLFFFKLICFLKTN